MDPDDITILENVPKDKSNDGKFVRMCLQYLYKGNEQILEERSLNGYRKLERKQHDGEMYVQDKKLSLTPIKVKIIHCLMRKRLENESVSEIEIRMKLNQKIANAINTVQRINE